MPARRNLEESKVDSVSFKGFDQKTGKEANIHGHEEYGNVEAAENRIYALTKRAIEQKKIHIGGETEIDRAHELVRFYKHQ